MKNKATVYLHEMVKALLVYEPELAKELLGRYYPHWKLFSDRYTVVVRRPEAGLKRFVDVVWVLKPVERGVGWFMLLFEVKTGRFSMRWVKQIEEIDRCRHHIDRIIKPLAGNAKVGYFHMYVLLAKRNEINTFLKVAEEATIVMHPGFEAKLINYIRSGWIRPIELEIFLPVVRRRLEELLTDLADNRGRIPSL